MCKMLQYEDMRSVGEYEAEEWVSNQEEIIMVTGTDNITKYIPVK